MTKSPNKQNHSRVATAVILAICFSAIAGCGTTPLVLKLADPRIDFAQYEALVIQTTTAQANVSGAAQTRIRNLVKDEILRCCPSRFKNVSVDSTQPHDLLLNIKLTAYDEGNAAARFISAGLGSMQIHGQVEIIEPKSGSLLSAGEAGKTFAWGGIYGAMTGIEDLEKDFAQEVITGLRNILGERSLASP